MTALTKDRNTRFKFTGRTSDMKVAASQNIFAGSMVSRNATGFLIPAADTAATTVLGVADHAGDNSTGADGDVHIRVKRGPVAEFATVGTVVDQADVGLAVFVSDDQTVEKTAGVVNNIVAGVLESIDPETGQAWVKLRDPTV